MKKKMDRFLWEPGQFTVERPGDLKELSDSGGLVIDFDISQTRNVFCPTGPGGGVDPHCSPGGGPPSSSAAELTLSSPEVVAVKEANRLSARHLIFGQFTKTHTETRKQVISTLEELADRYGLPRGGIHVVEMSGGSGTERAQAGVGTRVVVSKEEAKRLKDAGVKTFTLPGAKGGFVYQVQDQSAYRLALFTNGSKTQAGFDQSPERYTQIRESKKGWTFASGQGGIKDTITHEYGHFITYMTGHEPGSLSREPADKSVAGKISGYAAKNKAEMVAEGFVKYHSGNREEWLVKALRPYLPPTANEVNARNAFCPTGPGGGVDPHCSPGGGEYKTIGGWTYKDGKPLPKEEHKAYQRGERPSPSPSKTTSSSAASPNPTPSQKHTDPLHTLTPDELSAIQDWSMGGFDYVHAYERGAKGVGPNITKYSRTLYSALDKMPKHQGLMHRAAGISSGELAQWTSVGSVVESKLTESFTKSVQTARNVFLRKILESQGAKPDSSRVPVLLTVKSKTAADISSRVISVAEKEGEAVGRKGTRYKVKSAVNKGTHWEIRLEELSRSVRNSMGLVIDFDLI